MMEEQAIACLKPCGAAEMIREDSDRLIMPDGRRKWPAWEPGYLDVECPRCRHIGAWVTEPRLVEEASP